MATFTCSACNFSKPVADEMAGKKARCPKCNAVCDIPPLSAAEVEVNEADTGATENQTTSDSTDSSNQTQQQAATPVDNTLQPIPKNWLMAFGGAILLVFIAAALFVLQVVNIGIVCFAAGILSFAVMSALYCFKK